MEVNVIMLDDPTAFVDFIVTAAISFRALLSCEGLGSFHIRDDAVNEIPFSRIFVCMLFLYIFQFCTILATIGRIPPHNFMTQLLCNFLNVIVQLICKNAHDTVGMFTESCRSKEVNHSALTEQRMNIAAKDNPVEATIDAFDVVTELPTEFVVHAPYDPNV